MIFYKSLKFIEIHKFFHIFFNLRLTNFTLIIRSNPMILFFKQDTLLLGRTINVNCWCWMHAMVRIEYEPTTCISAKLISRSESIENTRSKRCRILITRTLCWFCRMICIIPRYFYKLNEKLFFFVAYFASTLPNCKWELPFHFAFEYDIERSNFWTNTPRNVSKHTGESNVSIIDCFYGNLIDFPTNTTEVDKQRKY